jgi:16S rRNA C967 or C1407 C5-methylase (RsmB/RsmF family)/NOL1/NOP2/fmu family ribosome biogenesis protein
MHLPKPLLDALEAVEGFNRSSFIDAHHTLPPVSVRYHPNKKLDVRRASGQFTQGIAVRQSVPWCTNGVYLTVRPVFTLDPALHAGAYYVQEASSMFPEFLLREIMGASKGLKALDLCAAPGGKTTLLASMDMFDLVLSNEIIRNRGAILQENVVKWGDPKVFISQDDPVRFAGLPGYFDVLLVDAPCSGSGLFRKDPEAIGEWSEAHVLHCAERQKRILSDALPALREGGVLLYSTCSYSVEENEQIADWLLQEFPLESLQVEVPDEWGIVRTTTARGAHGYRFFPGQSEGEGLFMAAFRLQDSLMSGSLIQSRRSSSAQLVQNNIPGEWVDRSKVLLAWQAGEDVYLIPESLYSDHLALREVLHLRKSGVRAGQFIRNEFLPDHELVISLLVADEAPHIDVGEATALQFLRKQAPSLPSTPRGWYRIRYQDLTLGLVKQLGNRVNNYYPASWRILMS